MTIARQPITVLAHAAHGEEILTSESLEFLAHLERSSRARREALLRRRKERAAAFRSGERPRLLAETKDIRDDLSWAVRPAPIDLTDRRCEITGPTERKMMISALNSGARVFMSDFEDALSPSWQNVIDGQRNVRDVADRSITFARPDGSVDFLASDIATLTIRPRGLHLVERHLLVDEKPVSASVFDLSLAAFHSAARFIERGTGLYLYIPKIESHTEAMWWDELLAGVESALGIAHGSIRVTVLIETILAAYEMDEIVYALRDRLTALNAGRWDYIFSVLKKFGDDPSHLLPDRSQVTMATPFMAAYAERLVAICHQRGAHAIGGMSAFIPNRSKPDVTARAVEQVRLDKEREAALGYDGTWVAHPDLVPVATAAFDAVLGSRPNQLEVRREVPSDVDALLSTDVPGGSRTRAGLALNVAVSLIYLESWIAGRGAVAIFDLMEDMATAEISRTQLWQWVQHHVVLEDGTVVDRELVQGEIDETIESLSKEGHDRALLERAGAVISSAIAQPELADFLTYLIEPD
jgi:malate synthase